MKLSSEYHEFTTKAKVKSHYDAILSVAIILEGAVDEALPPHFAIIGKSSLKQTKLTVLPDKPG